MKKIAIITTGLSKVFAGKKCGGGEILLKNLIFELMNMPDVCLYIFTPDENELTQNIKKDYPDINFIIYHQPYSSYKYVDELKQIFDNQNFDKIINYNMYIPYKTTILQSHSYIHKFKKTCFIFQPIKSFFLKNKILLQKNALKKALNDSDYIAVSQTIKNDYCKNFNIPEDKIKVIYPGVNIQSLNLDIKQDILSFGIVANSSINKGGHLLLFAIGILNILKRKFQLKIIAPKFKKDLLMQFIITVFNLRKKVESFPFQNDMSNFYSKIDVLVLPSLNEAFGLVALEAMERGKPCLISSFAGSSEIITEYNGFIFNRSSFLDFIKKLDNIIKIYNTDFERFEKTASCARHSALLFSWEKFAKKVIDKNE